MMHKLNFLIYITETIGHSGFLLSLLSEEQDWIQKSDRNQTYLKLGYNLSLIREYMSHDQTVGLKWSRKLFKNAMQMTISFEVLTVK